MQVGLIAKACFCDNRQESDFNVTESVYNNYRNSATHNTSKKFRRVTVDAVNILHEFATKAKGHTHAYVKIDIEGGEFDIIDQLPTVRDIFQEAGVQKLFITLEYSLDLEPKLENWLFRLHLAHSTCDAVRSEQYSSLHSRISRGEEVFTPHGANNADVWHMCIQFPKSAEFTA